MKSLEKTNQNKEDLCDTIIGRNTSGLLNKEFYIFELNMTSFDFINVTFARSKQIQKNVIRKYNLFFTINFFTD